MAAHHRFAVFVLFGLLSGGTGAQLPTVKAAPPVYTKPPAHAKTYQVDQIEGQVVFAPASDKGVYSARDLQITLFDAKHVPVRTVVSGDRGQFEIKDVSPGSYTLIVVSDTLDMLSIPLQVRESEVESEAAGPGLLLTMRSNEYVTQITRITASSPSPSSKVRRNTGRLERTFVVEALYRA